MVQGGQDIMSIRILAYIFAGILSIGMIGCEERNAGDAIEDATESAGEGIEDMGEEAEDAADDVEDGVEDAVN